MHNGWDECVRETIAKRNGGVIQCRASCNDVSKCCFSRTSGAKNSDSSAHFDMKFLGIAEHVYGIRSLISEFKWIYSNEPNSIWYAGKFLLAFSVVHIQNIGYGRLFSFCIQNGVANFFIILQDRSNLFQDVAIYCRYSKNISQDEKLSKPPA